MISLLFVALYVYVNFELWLCLRELQFHFVTPPFAAAFAPAFATEAVAIEPSRNRSSDASIEFESIGT